MKKVILTVLTAATIFSLPSCKKNEPVRPAAAEATAKQTDASPCTDPPVLLGAYNVGASGVFNRGYRLSLDAGTNLNVFGTLQTNYSAPSVPVNFNPSGTNNLVATKDSHIYKLVLNSSSQFVSVSDLGLTGNADVAFPRDAAGNKYVSNAEAFYNGPNLYYKLALSKVNAAGNQIWKAYLGKTTPGDLGYINFSNVAVDNAGNVYAANPNGFIYKFNTAGQLLIAKDQDDVYPQLQLDQHNNIYIYGLNSGKIKKVSPAGNILWEIQNYPTSTIGPVTNTLTVDAAGNVYTGGYISETTDMDPGPGVYNLTLSSRDSREMFIQKLDASGNFVWALQSKTKTLTNSGAAVTNILIDPTGQYVLATGYASSSSNNSDQINYGNGVYLPIPGYAAMFLLNYKQCH